MPNESDYTKRTTGRLFVFEGADGVGKSTVVEKVAKKLRKSGTDVLVLSFPGREPETLGNLVYAIHHDTTSQGIHEVSPASLQILHIAAHVDCLERQILPALIRGKTVILDRYWWSTVAYGTAVGISWRILNAMIVLEKTVWGNIKPDNLFLIKRDKPFRAELSNKRWSQVCNAYTTLANEEMKCYPVNIIVNSKSLGNIVDKILEHIENAIPSESKNMKFKQKYFEMIPYLEHRKRHPEKMHWAPTKTTEVFDTYWKFATERQAIFCKRLKGHKEPCTKDPILQKYKFTNTYRASDRVSQFLIRHVIYEGEPNPKEVIFRTLLFKTFNKIETWKLLVKKLGHISWREYDFKVYDKILTKAQKDKRSIYSAAYIMPSKGSSFKHKVKHRNHLSLLETMMNNELPSRIYGAGSMQEVFTLLRGYPMIGDFLAYQYAIDINYSTLTDFSESSFVVPGPGAKDGLRKCFSDFGGLSEVDLIKLTADRQEDEFARLGLQFQDLWGRPLQLIDCQNIFCEVDKYARIAHPNIKGITGRDRIKQKYRLTPDPIEYFYPPKWNINEAVKKTLLET